MQSSALKTINKYLPSFTPSQSKDCGTFLLFKNQLPDTFSDFIDIIDFWGNFFLKSSNSTFIFSIPEKVLSFISFSFWKYFSFAYFLFQIQYSAFTRFTQPTQLEQFRQE